MPGPTTAREQAVVPMRRRQASAARQQRCDDGHSTRAGRLPRFPLATYLACILEAVMAQHVDRRGFLLGSAALLAACANDEGAAADRTRTPTTTTTGSTPPAPGIDLGPELAAGVPRSLAHADRAELDIQLNLLAGELPGDWHGHGHWVHAVPYADGTSVFVGDGKVLRVTFEPQRAVLRSRVVKTPCHHYDRATLGQPHGFENQGFARMSVKVGFRNFANTALVAMQDRLLLTSDAGRPWELEPASLDIATAVGWNREWTGILPSVLDALVDWVFPLHMTTAHPAVDPHTQELFTVNYGLALLGSATADTHLLVWDGVGEMKRWKVLDGDGRDLSITQSVHQMVITRNYVVLMDTAFVVEVALGGRTPDTVPQSPDTALHIIARADLEDRTNTVQAYTIVLPRESVHFAADYEDDDGIALLIAHNVGADPSEMARAGDVDPAGQPIDPALFGLPASATDIGIVARYVIDPSTGRVVDRTVRSHQALWGGPALVTQAEATPAKLGAMFWSCAGVDRELQLRRIIDLYGDHPHREVALADVPDRTPATLVHINGQTAEVMDQFAFPQGRWGVSPCFVPRRDPVNDVDGYVVITVITDDESTDGSSGDELWVFDAADLAAGPVARLGHPDLSMPFTLHTLWLPRADTRSAAYMVDVELDHDLKRASQAVKDTFETAVFPAFA